jgi:nicotinamidase-related amidase
MSTPLRVTVRYLAMHSRDPEENVEARIWPVDEPYEIDPRQAALVLVDTWNKHPIRSHLEASGRVMRERITPLLTAARAASLALVYAPSPDVAPSYPQWQRRFGGRAAAAPVRPAWPPPELRAREGEWARYRRRPGETPAEYDGPYPDWWRWDAIADSVAPEPDDHVVATGAELHELLAEWRTAFLFYVGFATNICVLHRDYGILAMGARGYLPILLRDCTVGIETRDTLDGHLTTRLAIHDVERRYYSAASTDLIAGLRAVAAG